jgi:hypothetical protein
MFCLAVSELAMGIQAWELGCPCTSLQRGDGSECSIWLVLQCCVRDASVSPLRSQHHMEIVVHNHA